MPRARNVKPALFKNELLGTEDPLVTLLFISLWTLADRSGRLEDRPLRIRAETFPYRDTVTAQDVNGYLTVLERLGFIQRYEAAGMRLISIVNFEKHQSPHKTERASTLPGPPEISDSCCRTVRAPLEHRESMDQERPDSVIPDSVIPEGEGAQETPKPKRTQTARGARLALDDLPDDWRDWAKAEAPHIDIQRTWDTFADYWRAQPGQKGVKMDWAATWRNWVRREAKSNESSGKGRGESRTERGIRLQQEAEQRAIDAWNSSGMV